MRGLIVVVRVHLQRATRLHTLRAREGVAHVVERF
jgi:hypothetical protein